MPEPTHSEPQPPSRGRFVTVVVVATVMSMAAACQVGVDRLVAASGIRYDRLSEVVFPIWNTRPLSRHGFAGALSIEAFDRGQVYTGHPPAMLAARYVAASVAQRLWPGPLGHSSNILPFVYVPFTAAMFAWLAWTSSYTRGPWSIARLGLLGLLLMFLLTARPLWLNMLVIHADNPFPVVACLMVALIPFVVDGQDHRRGAAAVGLIAFALAAPIYVPVVLGSLVVLGSGDVRTRERWRPLVGAVGTGNGIGGRGMDWPAGGRVDARQHDGQLLVALPFRTRRRPVPTSTRS